MSSPICLFCGYARSVPVAGCDHATLPAAKEPRCAWCGDTQRVGKEPCGLCTVEPTAGEEMAAAFRAMEPLQEQALPPAGGEDLKMLREGLECYSGGCDPQGYTDAVRALGRIKPERAELAHEAARLRAEAAILGPELVDLQRQVVAEREAKEALQRRLNALHAELLSESALLESALRDNGRLRADLESARQLLDDAEARS